MKQSHVVALIILIIFLSGCFDKKNQSALDSVNKEPIDIDSLLNKEQPITLTGGRLSNLDLVRGYHSVNLGMKAENIFFNSSWRSKTTCDSVVTYDNGNVNLVFFRDTLGFFEVWNPYEDLRIHGKISIFEILRMKFGEPNSSDFAKEHPLEVDPDVAREFFENINWKKAHNYHSDDVYSFDGTGYWKEAIWQTKKTTMNYSYYIRYFFAKTRYGYMYQDSADFSVLQIKENDWWKRSDDICDKFMQDSLSKKEAIEKKERDRILKSN